MFKNTIFLGFREMSFRRKMTEVILNSVTKRFNYVAKTNLIGLFEN